MICKTILSATFIFLNISICLCQLEFRIRPLDLLFEEYNLHLELPISKEISTEVNGNYFDNEGRNNLFNLRKSRAFRTELLGKYYFRPIRGNDRLFTGVYLAYNAFDAADLNFFAARLLMFHQKDITPGIIVGYKWLGYSGVSFELYSSYGQSVWATRSDLNFVNDKPQRVQSTQEFSFRIGVGYRFSKKERNK